MAKLTLSFSEFKRIAFNAVKEKYPNIIDDDTVKFTKEIPHEGVGDCYELPDYVEFNLEDKNE